MNLFDFSNLQSDLNPLGAALKPQNTGAFGVSQPTGGGMMPPTPQAQPLAETPIDTSKLDQAKIQSFISYSKQNGKTKDQAMAAFRQALSAGAFDKKMEPKKETFWEMATWAIADEASNLYGTISGAVKKTGEAFVEGAKQIGKSAYQIKEGLTEWKDIWRPLIEGLTRGVGGVVFSPVSGVAGQAIEWSIAPAASILTPQVVKDLAKAWFANAQEWYNSQSEPVKQLIKDAWLTAEWALNLVWVKASPKIAEAALKWAAKVTQAEIKWAEALVKWAAQGSKATWEALGTVGRAAKWLVTKSDEAIAEGILGTQKPALIAGKKVLINEPKSTISQTITAPLRTSDTKVLAWRAIAPRGAGLTPKGKINIVADAEKNATELYNMVRTGKIKGSVETLEDAAQTVVDWLDEVWSKIGKAVENAKGTVSPSVQTMQNIASIASNPVEQIGWAIKPLNQFIETLKNGLSIQDAFKAKKIFGAEIRKLIKAGDTGTDAYSALVKSVQELSDNIDTAVVQNLKWSKYAELKNQYATLKKLAWDITQSAMVEGRRSPQTLVEQLGMLETMGDIIRNPLSWTYRATAGKLIADMAELNTRGGAWKEFVRLMDKRAIEAAKKAPLKKSPIISNGKLQSAQKSVKSWVIPKQTTDAKTIIKPTKWNAPVSLENGASKPKSLRSLMRSKGGFIKIFWDTFIARIKHHNSYERDYNDTSYLGKVWDILKDKQFDTIKDIKINIWGVWKYTMAWYKPSTKEIYINKDILNDFPEQELREAIIEEAIHALRDSKWRSLKYTTDYLEQHFEKSAKKWVEHFSK